MLRRNWITWYHSDSGLTGNTKQLELMMQVKARCWVLALHYYEPECSFSNECFLLKITLTKRWRNCLLKTRVASNSCPWAVIPLQKTVFLNMFTIIIISGLEKNKVIVSDGGGINFNWIFTCYLDSNKLCPYWTASFIWCLFMSEPLVQNYVQNKCKKIYTTICLFYNTYRSSMK